MGEWRIEGVPATFRIEEDGASVALATGDKKEVGDAIDSAQSAHSAPTEAPPADGEASAAAGHPAAAGEPVKPSALRKQTLVIVFDDAEKNIESRVFNAMITPIQKKFNEALRSKNQSISAFAPPPRTARAVPPAQQAAHAAAVEAENRQHAAEAAAAEAAGVLPAQPSAHRTSAERAGLRPPRPTATSTIAAPQAAPRGHRPAPAAPSLARRPAGQVPNLGNKR